jgi:hypothetical protein
MLKIVLNDFWQDSFFVCNFPLAKILRESQNIKKSIYALLTTHLPQQNGTSAQ